MISTNFYKKKELQSTLKTVSAEVLHFTADPKNQRLFRLSERKVHCLAMPCTSPAQPELASYSTLFLIIFICVCVHAYGGLSASSWSGTTGHRAVCLGASRASGLGAREGLCMTQTGRAMVQVHVWVHDSPAKRSYWRHP